MTSAVFLIEGKRCSLKEALRISVLGTSTRSEYSFRSQFRILTGPDALLGLSLTSNLSTRLSVTCGISGDSSKGKRGGGMVIGILPIAPGKLP